MCEDDSFDDMVAYRLRREQLSRRGFGVASLGAGLASLATVGCKSTDATPGPVASPAGATPGDAVATTEAEVNITTPDGVCDAYFVHPASGAAPAVIVWPDIFGLRPAFRQMGKRLAGAGYAVLVVNPFYRVKKAPTSAPQANFEDKATREGLMALMGTLTAETATTDAKALTAWLDQQPSVDRARKMGTAGYCMGGPIVFRTAAANPERVGAAATFHGGGLVSDKPDSPHLLIPGMKARFLIAIAGNDDAKQPDAKGTLKAAFAQASLPANIEVYEAAKHGWCPPDSHVYDRELAEKAWGQFVALLKESLGLARPHQALWFTPYRVGSRTAPDVAGLVTVGLQEAHIGLPDADLLRVVVGAVLMDAAGDVGVGAVLGGYCVAQLLARGADGGRGDTGGEAAADAGVDAALYQARLAGGDLRVQVPVLRVGRVAGGGVVGAAQREEQSGPAHHVLVHEACHGAASSRRTQGPLRARVTCRPASPAA